MRDPLDIFFSDAASPEALEELRSRLISDEELRRQVAVWAYAIERERTRWDELVPDRRLLPLLVLRNSNREELLTDEDRAYLEANQEIVNTASRELVSMADVTQKVADECSAFEKAWDEHFAETRRAPDRSPVVHGSRKTAARWLWRAPIAVAVVSFAIIAVLLFQRGPEFETVSTLAGETRVIEFADGSSIRLFENSRLHYVPDEQQSLIHRKAILDGRALFDVASQQQGMIVETSNAMVSVLGTLFGVVGSEDETEVTLVEGRLAVSGLAQRNAAVVLDPGQQSRVVGGGMPSTPAEVDLDAELAWTGLFVFRGVPLGRIVERLSEHYNTSIEVDGALAQEQLTGTFEHDQPLLSILRTLAAAVDARVAESATGFRIEPR